MDWTLNPTADTKPPLAINERVTWDIPVTALRLVSNETKKAEKLASQPNPATHEKSTGNRNRLVVNKSGSKGHEVWTVRADKIPTRKGVRRAVFRVREETKGWRTHLRFWDGSRYREPYCCYLSAGEWADARKGSFHNFVSLIATKIEQRRAAGEADPGKLDDLLRRVRAFEIAT